MKTIEEYTNYLLNCHFTDDSFDPEDHEEHLQASWELFENYSWEEIAPVWMMVIFVIDNLMIVNIRKKAET